MFCLQNINNYKSCRSQDWHDQTHEKVRMGGLPLANVWLIGCRLVKPTTSSSVTRVTRMAYSPRLWLMAIGW